MSIRINCPSCEAPNTVDEDKRGRKVRCRKCQEPIAVPTAKKKLDEDEAIQDGRKVKAAAASSRKRQDDDEDGPAEKRPALKKKVAKAAQGSSTLMLVGGIAVVLLFCLVGVGGIGGYFVFRSKPVAPEQDQQAKAEDKKPAGNQAKVDNTDNKNPKNDIDKNKKQDPLVEQKKDLIVEPKKNPPIDPDAGKPLPNELPLELVPRIKQATVYLRVTMPSGQVSEGSGFFALEPGIVITNAHVLGMLQAKSAVPKNVQVVVHSGEVNERKFIGDVLGVDRASDLAVVRVLDNNLPAPLTLESKREVIETQKVYIIGYPLGAGLGKEVTVANSTVSSLRKDPITRELDQIQVNGGMHPGNSGGPVVNTLGNLIGVAVAGIRGTQINFAVPADKVRMIMEGRLADARHGEAFVQGGEVRLPVAYTFLDPRNQIRDLKVEVWTGMPGPARPNSAEKPKALPNDGPRQSHAVAYQNFAGNLDVPLPQLAPGQVYWLQPVITTKAGATRWGIAQPTSAALIPIERKGANLTVSLTAQKERTVNIASSWTVTLLKGREKKVFADKIDTSMLEVLTLEPKGAAVSASIGAFTTSSEDDGKPIPLNPQVPGVMKQIPPLFIIDGTNKIRVRSDRNLNPKMNPLLRNQVEDTYTQLCNSLEAVTMPMPNRPLQPKEQFATEIPMMLRSGKKPEVVDLSLSCTFEGTRQRNQRSEGVISLVGIVKGRGLNAKKIGGDIAGKMAFDLSGGFISQAQLTITTEQEILGGELQAIYAFDIALKREPGNPQGIPLPQEYKPGPGPEPVAKGKILLNINGMLAPNDPIDPTAKGNQKRMKVFPVTMAAGKTYVITLNSDQFDSYLRLEDPLGRTVAEDDDGGGYPNAKIVYRAAQPGLHRVVATTFDGKLGAFQLTVIEADAPGIPVVNPKDPKVQVPLPKAVAFKQPAKSPNPTNYMKVVSAPGDFIGQGKNYDYRADELIVKKTPRGLNIRVDGWILDIGAPTGQFLQVGEYQNAKRFPFSKEAPGLNFHGKGRGANKLAGEFVVWEFEMNGDQVVRLAIDFVQRAEEKGPPLTGKIRINSTLE